MALSQEEQKLYEKQQLYEKFREQMNGNRERRVELFGLVSLMVDFADPDLKEIAFQCEEDYFAVKNPDGSLNKEKFEQRIKEIEEYKVDHMYLPAIELIDQDQNVHSDYWLKERLTNDSEYAALYAALAQAVTGQLMGLDNEIKQAYEGEGLNDVLARLNEDRRNAVVFAESEELQDKVSDVVRFFGLEDDLMKKKSKEYVVKQKQMRKQEVPESSKEHEERFFSNVYKLFAGKDMSFLDDKEYRRVQTGMLGFVRKQLDNPEWTPTDPADKSLYELSTTIDGLAEELKNASGYRFSDSSQFHAVKDRVAEIQKQIKGGSSLENREVLFESVTKLGEECQAYLDKNAGKRFTKRGNLRKDIVGRLKALAEDQKQKLHAPENEQKMEREPAKDQKQKSLAPEGKKTDAEIEKMDLKDLMEVEGKSAPSRKAAGPEMKKKSPENEKGKSMGSIGK